MGPEVEVDSIISADLAMTPIGKMSKMNISHLEKRFKETRNIKSKIQIQHKLMKKMKDKTDYLRSSLRHKTRELQLNHRNRLNLRCQRDRT